MDQFEFCARWAATLPKAETIYGEDGPYLSKYALGESPDGGRAWLHYFHRGDVDSDLHDHPWAGESLILAGGYSEERRHRRDETPESRAEYVALAIELVVCLPDMVHTIVRRRFLPNSTNIIAADTFHRVDLLDPRGCWTLFRVGPKKANANPDDDSWSFWDRKTGVTEPWRKNLARRGLLARHPAQERE